MSAPIDRWPQTTSPPLLAWQRAMSGMVDGDRTLVREAFSADADWYDIFSGSLHGNQVIAEHLGGMKGRDFDQSEVQVLRMVADGTQGAIEWTQTLRTGEHHIRIEGVTIVEVAEGRITRLCDYIQPLKNRTP
jgi:limonene-1,2-epoxide hydrolase